jgi:diaminopimelate decarboxylase
MELNINLLNNISLEFGDSFYLLDSKRFAQNYDEFLAAFTCIYPKTTIGYSYKTNYTPDLCQIVDQKGGYAEVVSEMEYDLALLCRVSPEKIIVNGPYKPRAALKRFLENGSIVNLDGFSELALVETLACQNPEQTFRIGLRCNFSIDNNTVSRFGFDVKDHNFFSAIKRLRGSANITISGIHCHFPDRNAESYNIRADKILDLSQRLFKTPPSYIDIGGGYFGKMEETLKRQFGQVHEYAEYGNIIASRFAEFFSAYSTDKKPILILEPGSALVADTMRYIARVIDIKTIRGKRIAMSSGSKFNIGLLSSTVNMPLQVFSESASPQSFDTIDISGYTCIESDYIYKGYNGRLAIGDYLVFSNVGSYSIVFKPPFILPNVPVLETNDSGTNYRIVKRQETVDDIFQTFNFEKVDTL